MAQLDFPDFRNTVTRETIDFNTLIRTGLLAVVFLVLWISLRPFDSLAEAPEVSEAGNIATQLSYSLLFILLFAWCLSHQPARLLLLARPILIASLAWIALSVLASLEPTLSFRRFAFMLVTLGIGAMVMLLPKNVRHFGDVLAAVVVIVLALCYLGVLFAPSLSIHQSTDFVEPELAGDWRGVFAHKNGASATMVLFVFIGLFVSGLGNAAVGGVIVALAVTFLAFTQSKNSIALLPIVLIVSALMRHLRSRAMGITVAVSGIIVCNIISVGSIYYEPLRNLLDLLLPDATFTGRTEVWQFVVDHIRERPLFGFGFASFWGTPEVVYGMDDPAIWANTAAHAHNGYLDLALTIGIPGAVLVVLWLVILPSIDFYRSTHQRSAEPLRMLFLRVILFMAYASCFENMLLQEGAATLFLFAATFGMRFLSVSRVTR